MSTAGIKAGRAFVEITTNNKGLEAGLRRAQAQLGALGAGMQAVGSKMAAAGAVGLTAFAGTLAVFAKQGDELQKMALRTGISVEALSELGYAAGQSGSSIETLEKGVRKMQQGITEAATGTGAAKDAFAELGIEVSKLASMTPEEQFLRIAGRLATVQDATKRASLAMDVFGRAGTELIPMLSDGNAGIEALRERARALGLTMSADAADSAAAFGDHLADIVTQAKKVAFELGAAVAPAIQSLIVRVQTVLKSVIDWTRANSEVILTALKITAAITATGGALIAFGLAFKLAAASIGFVIAAAAAVKAAIVGLGATILAVATSPLALVTAGVVGLAAAFLDLGGIASQVGQYLADVFGSLKARALAVFDGIKAAMAGGDFKLAAQILWLGIKAEWARGIESLTGAWVAFRDGFIDTWSSAVQFFAEAFITGIGLIKVAWADFGAFFKNIWEDARAGVGNFFTDWKTGIAEGSIEFQNMIGLLDDAERNGALQMLGQENQAEKGARNAARDANKAQIAKDAEAARQSAVGQVQGQLAQLDQEAKAERDNRAKAAAAAADAANSELKQAQKELADAIAQANAAAATMADPALPAAPGRRAAAAALEDGAGAAIESRRSTTGTFSARAAGAMGETKPVVDAIVKTGTTHAELLRRILDQMRDGAGGLA